MQEQAKTEQKAEHKAVPVVVTLSGIMHVDLPEGMTAEELQAYAIEHWNIDTTKVDESFVVKSDVWTNRTRMCQGTEDVTDHLSEESMLRVVLPLVSKG